MSRKKDSVAVKSGGTKEHKRNRLVLDSLSDVYAAFNL
jgi:hypothetical protein